MSVCWQGFTAGTEIGVVANRTLIAITHNIALGIDAQWSVAVYSTMVLLGLAKHLESLVDRNKAMTRMLFASRGNTGGAIVEIWARQAFVSNAINVLRWY